MTLWDALADAPEKINGQPLADRVFTWAVSYAVLWYRNRRRRDGCAAPRVLGWMVVAVSVLAGPIFGVAVLALFWWRSMPAHDEWLTLWIGLCFWFAALVGLTGSLTARDRMAGATRTSVAMAHKGRRTVGGILAILLAIVSWARTEGGLEDYWEGSPIRSEHTAQIIPLASADLEEAELTPKPRGWLPYPLWRAELEENRNRSRASARVCPTTSAA